jgi:hypothetical protein
VRLGDCVTVLAGDFADEDGGDVHHLLRITEIFYTAGVRAPHVQIIAWQPGTRAAWLLGLTPARRGCGVDRLVAAWDDK